MTRAQESYMRAQAARIPVGQGTPAIESMRGKNGTPTGSQGLPPRTQAPAPTPPTLNPKFAGQTWTGNIIPNPNTGKAGFGSDTNPYSGVWNDPINGAGTKTIPLDSTGHPVFTPPVGPPYTEHNDPMWMGHEAEWQNSDKGTQMRAMNLDPLNQRDNWIFNVMFDPNTPASVQRQLRAAGVTTDAFGAPLGTRHNLSDLSPEMQARYTQREGNKAWQNATVDSANIGRNRQAFGGTGLQYNDPNIPAYGDQSWTNAANQRHANWVAGGTPAPGPSPGQGPYVPPGASNPFAPPTGGTSSTQSFTSPIPPSGSPQGVMPQGVTPAPGAVMSTNVLPPASARAPIGVGGVNPFLAGLARQRGGVVYG